MESEQFYAQILTRFAEATNDNLVLKRQVARAQEKETEQQNQISILKEEIHKLKAATVPPADLEKDRTNDGKLQPPLIHELCESKLQVCREELRTSNDELQLLKEKISLLNQEMERETTNHKMKYAEVLRDLERITALNQELVQKSDDLREQVREQEKSTKVQEELRNQLEKSQYAFQREMRSPDKEIASASRRPAASRLGRASAGHIADRDNPIVIEDDNLLDLPLYVSALPVTRSVALQQYLRINVDNNDTWFTREHIKMKLGGNIQPLITNIGAETKTALAQKHGISRYLCPNLEHNPWCPSIPGHHGYMFVGLGRERETFLIPETLHVFVGMLPPHTRKTQKIYWYLGEYQVQRVNDLTVDEWHSLPADVKDTYSITTSKKTDGRSPSAISKDYDVGALHVPCVRLTCVDFNKDLLAALKVGRPSTLSSASPQRSPNLKRKRASDDVDAVKAEVQ